MKHRSKKAYVLLISSALLAYWHVGLAGLSSTNGNSAASNVTSILNPSKALNMAPTPTTTPYTSQLSTITGASACPTYSQLVCPDASGQIPAGESINCPDYCIATRTIGTITDLTYNNTTYSVTTSLEPAVCPSGYAVIGAPFTMGPEYASTTSGTIIKNPNVYIVKFATSNNGNNGYCTNDTNEKSWTLACDASPIIGFGYWDQGTWNLGQSPVQTVEIMNACKQVYCGCAFKATTGSDDYTCSNTDIGGGSANQWGCGDSQRTYYYENVTSCTLSSNIYFSTNYQVPTQILCGRVTNGWNYGSPSSTGTGTGITPASNGNSS